MAAILLAAGAFTGIMKGSGMLAAMAAPAVHAVPPAMARHLPFAARPASRCRSACCSIPTRSISARCRSIAEVGKHARRAADPDRAGGAPRPDDDRLSGQPADAGDVPGRRARPASSSASTSASPAPCLFARLRRHDDRRASCSECSRCEDRADWLRRRVFRRSDRAGGRARRRTGRLDYLVFECLAERTIALAQQARARDPRGGYDPLLERADRGRAAGLSSSAASRSSPTWARPIRQRPRRVVARRSRAARAAAACRSRR